MTTMFSATTEPTLTNASCDVVSDHHINKNVVFTSAVYTMYGTIFLMALLGNVFVCYIVLQSPRMRTVTNYFIMNLAVGDILTALLCVPFTSVPVLLQYWPFGSFMCTLVNYVTALSVFVSAYTLVAISIDKYMLIMYPLKPRISKRSATWIIAGVWVFAGITVLPSGIFARVYQPQYNDTEYANETVEPENKYIKCDKYICQEDYRAVGDNYRSIYTTLLMVMQYIVPLIVLLFTYTSIAAVIWCHRIPGEAENLRDKRMARSKRKMIKMMITVVFVFTLCWLPYNMFMIFQEDIYSDVKPYVFFALHGLAMSHACYNPIIYCYMNSRFRDGLFHICRMLPCCKGCYMRKNRGSLSSTFHRHAGLEGSESTSLQRNNTFTTYITLNRKNRLSTYQTPSRSASLMKNVNNVNGAGAGYVRRKRSSKEMADEPI
ncbi:RYamide receptor-like [Sitophilus oryzae]|uniref:RYamide receptor-like n=1 Tax=Sitophilus oryzae TaxID=7048 RepID=A0A6J2YAF9_SITOR|nr:RYamide receptor-like [Sitophilus oryzae]